MFQIFDFTKKTEIIGAISQKSTVHLHPLHPPYAAPGALNSILYFAILIEKNDHLF